jgi:protein ImuB
MRRREAQAACPGLEVLARDEAAEARAWEAAVAAVEAFAPGVEVLAPGQLALGARGPSRYFGGEANLAAKVREAVEGAVKAAIAQGPLQWEAFCQVGLADGLFTAGLAARLAAGPVGQQVPVGQQAPESQQVPEGAVVVPVGGSAEFLHPLPLALLVAGNLPGASLPGTGGADFADLVDLLGRLGVKTFGDLAALPPASVLARFGAVGELARQLASGHGGSNVRGRRPPPDWAAAAELDPPAEDLSAAIFVGRALAERLHDRLASEGLACSRLAIEVRTEPSNGYQGLPTSQPGAVLRRSWRYDGALSAAAIAERVRWQLEGWRLGKPGRVLWLCLVPEEVHAATGHQLGIWGNEAGAAEKAGRALAKVQSMLGPEAVVTGVLQGGRGYAEQVRLVPWGEPREPLRPGAASTARPARTPPRARPAGVKAKDGPPPWPGRLPGIAPTLVHRSPLLARVLDEDGQPVTVGSRGEMSSPPAWVEVGPAWVEVGPRGKAGNEPGEAVGTWAGPWPFEERWWDSGGRRRARLQICTTGGRAYLLVREKSSWWVEATYD